MGTFDELFVKAKDLASAAGSKAQEMAEYTKLRLQTAQLRSDLDANYLKLGEIIYELQKAGADNKDLIDMCIAELESQNKELDELNEKINDLKNEKKCPECMASNRKDALFCSRCGASLHMVEPTSAESQTEDVKEPIALPQMQEEAPPIQESVQEPIQEPTEKPFEDDDFGIYKD